MKEFRCKSCHKLLFKWDCPINTEKALQKLGATFKTMNEPGTESSDLNPYFPQKIEIKCAKSNCGKLNILLGKDWQKY